MTNVNPTDQEIALAKARLVAAAIRRERTDSSTRLTDLADQREKDAEAMRILLASIDADHADEVEEESKRFSRLDAILNGSPLAPPTPPALPVPPVATPAAPPTGFPLAPPARTTTTTPQRRPRREYSIAGLIIGLIVAFFVARFTFYPVSGLIASGGAGRTLVETLYWIVIMVGGTLFIERLSFWRGLP